MTYPDVGRPACRRQTAFTMIEVLVVILIIGIIVNFVAVKLGGQSPSDELKAEARRFTALTELALEEALLRAGMIGILVTEQSYEFLRRGENDWEPTQEDVFRKRELPEDIHLRISSEQAAESMFRSEKKLPDILLLPSGEITPFELEFSSAHTDDSFRVSAEETGTLSLDHVRRD